MGKSSVRWGILSTAKIAQEAVIPAIVEAANAEVAAIASNSGRAKEAASRLHIPKAYESYEELLDDPDIDAVYIPLPNNMHAEWTIRAAAKGKHVLCEKPAALTERELKEMVEACAGNGVLFMEAFMYQFHPQHKRVKEIIASGEIGDVKLMRASFSYHMDPQERKKNIRMNRALGGGSLYDVGCYCLHAMRNILETEPAKIYAEAVIDPDHQVDVSVAGVCELANGVKGVFDCSFDMALRNKYEIVGTKGVIEVPGAFRPDFLFPDGSGLIRVTDAEGRTREERISGRQYTLEVEHFSQCVLEGKEPAYTGESSLCNMRAIDACYESIRSGKAVELR
ncbi:Gfo/Idh/MocA family oxidoreductase [Bacillaceae bacterium]